MSVHDSYVQCPIWMLQFGCSLDSVTAEQQRDRCNVLLFYAYWQLAHMIYRNAKTGNKYYGMIQRHLETAEDAEWCDEIDEEKYAAFLAAGELLRISPDRFSKYEMKRLTEFEQQHPDRHQTGKRIARIRMDIFNDAASGRISWRDFAVLFAIYAACNDKKKPAVKITNRQLAAMAAGYGSRKYVTQEHGEEQAAAILLTDRQVRSTREKLEGRGLFSHFAQQRGQWFSLRMTPEQLAHHVGMIRARQPNRRRILQQRKRNQKLIADAAEAKGQQRSRAEQITDLEELRAALERRGLKMTPEQLGLIKPR